MIVFGQQDEDFYIGVWDSESSDNLVEPYKVSLEDVMSHAVSLATKYRNKLAPQEDSADDEDVDADEAQRRYHNKMVKLGHRKGPIFSKKNFKQNYQDYITQVRAGTSPYYK